MLAIGNSFGHRKVPRTSGEAGDLGALGGTPNLLIRRSEQGVRPVRCRPYPQVRAYQMSSTRVLVRRCPVSL